MSDSGRETEYHDEVLSNTIDEGTKAIALFGSEMVECRKNCPIDTNCMHGSPRSKYDDRNGWNVYDYHS